MDSNLHPRLVVVGASAGGIEALSVLVSTLPADFPAPVIVAQHMDSRRESHLGEILDRKSALPVRTVEEHEPLEAGVVYVVPSDKHVKITDSEIDLRVESAIHPKPSIDLLLNSAAETVGESLIAVILTGTGSDGTDGAVAVKKAGGTVVIQNPRTAEYPGMPQSLAPSTVDIVTELDRIGQVLQDLVTGVAIIEQPEEHHTLESLLGELRERNGIDFSSYKMPTILRRLQRRIVATGSASIDEYHDYLRQNPDEYQHLINSFLIKVTEFFRDKAMFEYLEAEVVPKLIEEARERNNQLRLWSAGCATGEEAYSLAILVAEALGDDLSQFSVRIFATDLDEEAVDFARRGVYSRAALENMPEEMVNRYFAAEDGNYQVNKMVRNMIVFGQHDLAQRASFPRIDMVVSRNVLIYFTPELQRRAMQLFAYSLRDGGRLLLGKAESVSPLGEYFAAENAQHKVFRRRGERFLMPPALMESPAPAPRRGSFHVSRSSQGASSAPQAGDHHPQRSGKAIDSFLAGLPVGVVMVDRHYDIQSINNPARQLLFIHSPAIGEDLIHLIQGPAYASLRPAIDAVFRERKTVEVEDFSLEEPGTGEPRHLRLSVSPHREETGEESTDAALIFITDVSELVRGRGELAEKVDSLSAELDRTKTLNQRLTAANHRLEDGNQDLTRLNEELRSDHEELLLNTEEAQAATEEVETLNEELQASNEELETLNEELQATVEELNTTNDDLQARELELRTTARTSEMEQAKSQAILESIGDAVLVVDTDGEVVFRNPVYERIFGEGDLDLRDLDGGLISPRDTPRQRVARQETFSMEFSIATRDGETRWFEVNGRPLQSGDSGQHGGVIVIHETGEREAEAPE